MLDVVSACLPKNPHGFRTTHTCELCGFEPKTKNKYREKQDHLVMKHFKEKIDKIFPHCRPYACPSHDCAFTGKDKQALLRHYTGKHGILDKYLKEALAEKGINYAPPEHGAKRRGSAEEGPNLKRQRLPQDRTSLSNISLDSLTQPMSPSFVLSNAPRPGADELRKEVEAMMATFQPQPRIVSASSMQEVAEEMAHQIVQELEQQQVIQHPTPLPCMSSSNRPLVLTLPSNAMSLSLPVLSLPTSLSASLPVPLEQLLAAAGATVTSSSAASTTATNVTFTTSTVPSSSFATSSTCSSSLSSASPSSSSDVDGELSLIEHGTEIMWGSGMRVPLSLPLSLPSSVTVAPIGPAVVVEAAESLPITCLDTIDALDSLDYDLLISGVTTVDAVRERQLDFCML